MAFVGLNRVAGAQYAQDDTIAASWVTQQLGTNCNLKSIVFIGHMTPAGEVNNALDTYFGSCSTLPTLTISGNAHPTSYCMKKTNERVDLTIEAFQSGPISVSIVQSPSGEHFFHASDADKCNSNSKCPNFVELSCPEA